MLHRIRYGLLFCVIVFAHIAYAQRSRVDSLKQQLNKTQDLSRKIELHGYIGEAYYNFSPDTAILEFEKGLSIARKFPAEQRDSAYWEYTSVLLNNAAFIRQRKGDLYNAVLLYNECVEMNKARNNKNGEATAYLNLGSLYSMLGDYDLALDFLKKSQKLSAQNDEISLANSYAAIGNIYMLRKNNIEAKNQFFAALALYQKRKHNSGLSKIYNKIGELYFLEKNYPVAQEYFNQSIAIASVEENYKALSESYYQLARIDFKRLAHNEAETKALKALEYAKITGYPENLRDATSLLYQIYKSENRSAEALAMYEVFNKMQDSLQAQDALKIGIQEKLRVDYENKTAQTKAAQKVKDERQQFIFYSGIIGFILLGILLFFVWRSYRIKKKANIEISTQRDIIQGKNKEILDSIHYAKRIQDALLPNEKLLTDFFADAFILFQPRDIVSGDFYWINQHADRLSLAVCDSTGHGVPGAFVSLLNLSFLNEAITEKESINPADVFNFTRQRLIERLSSDSGQDGMDAILFSFDKNFSSVNYAAANNKPVLIRNGILHELETDKMPIGKSPKEHMAFQTFTTPLQSGDILIAYTDGFADQFGGPKGKKFKYSQLHDLLRTYAALSLPDLKAVLQNSFHAWKGSLEQLDDVLVIGVRIP